MLPGMRQIPATPKFAVPIVLNPKLIRQTSADFIRFGIYGMIGVTCGYALISVCFQKPQNGANLDSHLSSSAIPTLADIEKDGDEQSRRKKITVFVQGLKSEGYEAALDLMLRTLTGDDRQFAITMLLKKWSEVSPVTAVEKAFALRVTVVPSKLWKELLSAWAKKSEKEALAWASAQPEGSRQREAIIAVAEVVLESDPVRAVRMLSGADLRAEDFGVLKKAIKQWAALSFDESSAYAKTIKDIGMQKAMVEALIEAREGLPVLETLQWLGSLPTGVFQQEAMSKLMRSWMHSDINAALKYAANDVPLSKKRAELLSYGVGLLARDRLADTIAFYKSLAVPDRALVLEALVSAGLSGNRQDTLAFIQGIPEENLRLKALGQAIGTLAKWSTTEAMELLNTFPQGSARAAAVGKFVTVLAETDPRAAADFCLKELPFVADTEWHKQLGPLIQKWGKMDIHAAAEWIRSLPEGTHKAWLLESALGNNHLLKEQMAIASSFDPATFAKMQEGIVFQWFQSDQEGKDWLAKMPESPGKDKIIGHIADLVADQTDRKPVNQMADLDQWLGGLNPREFDVAASRAAFTLASRKKDLVRALELSSKIKDPRRKFQTAACAYGGWVKRDPQAAAQWLNNTPLFPEPYKEKLRQEYATYANEDP